MAQMTTSAPMCVAENNLSMRRIRWTLSSGSRESFRPRDTDHRSRGAGSTARHRAAQHRCLRVLRQCHEVCFSCFSDVHRPRLRGPLHTLVLRDRLLDRMAVCPPNPRPRNRGRPDRAFPGSNAVTLAGRDGRYRRFMPDQQALATFLRARRDLLKPAMWVLPRRNVGGWRACAVREVACWPASAPSTTCARARPGTSAL